MGSAAVFGVAMGFVLFFQQSRFCVFEDQAHFSNREGIPVLQVFQNRPAKKSNTPKNMPGSKIS